MARIPPPFRPGRRRALKALALAGSMAAWPPLARAWPGPGAGAPPDDLDDGESVRTVEARFAFDHARGEVAFSDGRREPYRLVLDGLVGQPVNLDYPALAGLPRREQRSDFHCVEGWSLYDVPWSGPGLDTLLDLARPRPEARYAVFHALGTTHGKPGGLDHYVECLPLADLRDPRLGYLLALERRGRPLDDGHGAPARLVCPFDLGYKSIKFVTRIELSATEVPGWWTRANAIYPVKAPVSKRRLRFPDPRNSG